MLASELIDLLQEEQFGRFTPGPFRPVIVITPTYTRTFQRIHMIHLVNSLKQARAPLIWIVVEANGKSNDTRAMLSESGLDFVHLESKAKISDSWQERELAEVHLREAGLRYVHAARIDGLVVFADDSTVLSRSFFDEVQKVEWVGAMSVGIGIHEVFSQTSEKSKWTVNGHQRRRKLLEGKQLRFPVQGPVCDSNKTLTGWHTYPHYPQDFIEGLPEYSLSEDTLKQSAPAVRAPMVWQSFVLNSRLLWDSPAVPIAAGGAGGAEEASLEIPDWIRPFGEWIGEESAEGKVRKKDGTGNRADLLQRLVLDESRVQPLGRCGTAVMGWWLKADARSDSKYPPGWRVQGLEIVVRSKSTPWPKPEKKANATSSAEAGAESGAEGGEQKKGGDEGSGTEEETEQQRATRKGKSEEKWETTSKADKVSKAREALGSLGEFAEKHTKSMEDDGSGSRKH